MPASTSSSTTKHLEFEPGDLLLHPLALSALAVWLLNDHVLKALIPCWLTGKLSDVACLVVCPLLVVAAAELYSPNLSARVRQRVLWASLIFFGAIMAGIRISPFMATAYRYGLGAAQWCAFAIVETLRGRDLPVLTPVRLTMDVTDILTLPSLWLPAMLVRRLRPRAPGWSATFRSSSCSITDSTPSSRGSGTRPISPAYSVTPRPSPSRSARP